MLGWTPLSRFWSAAAAIRKLSASALQHLS